MPEMFEQPVHLTRKADRPQRAAAVAAPGAGAKELEADDPFALTGVRYPVADGVDADRETARTIIEEYALQGWPPTRIAGLFADPHAGHVHDIHRRRPGLVDELFDVVFPKRGTG